MKRMRWLILGICIMLCMAANAFAAQQGGLDVRITSDKKHYDPTENAAVVVTIENTTDRAVYNVEIESILPKELKSATGLNTLFIEVIPAHAKVSKTLHIMKNGVILTILSNKKHYHQDELAELTITVANHGDKAIYNVDITSYLPNGLQYMRMADDEMLHISRIDAGETVIHRIRVRVMEALPQTGDNTSRTVLMYTMLLAVSIALLIKCRRTMKCDNDKGTRQ